MNSLGSLRAFVRIAETGSLSAAARDLGLSKSVVSKKLAALEDRLGARLVNRTTRRLSLTEVGAAFLDRSQRILADLEEAEQAVGRLSAEPRGVLRVNAPMSFGILHVAPALGDFMGRYPDLAVHLDLADRRVDLVDEGYDLAVRVGDLPDSSLVARRLAPVRQAVCASPAYWDRRGRPSHPRDLKGHDGLIYTYLPSPNDWRFREGGRVFTVRVEGRLAANNGDALRRAALAGLGVFKTPTFIVGDDLRAGRLEAVLADFADDDLAVHAIYPHRRHLSAKVRAFVEFLGERFGPEPYWDRS